ncbi:MAG: bacteriohemerythrin [Rhodospirillales bacterium]|nr:bacteriohemerythrin [Rhodospirillales bacterium]MDP7600915.1 bacteriohemerythrin [Rhodospirillales bacterium]
MSWESKYSVGISKFDDDHQIILNLIDTYLTQSDSGLDLNTVRFIIDQLGDYSQTHFKAEETYMAEIKYPRLDDHRRLHHEMLDQLTYIRSQCEKGEASVVEVTAKFLHDWWNNHILLEDMAYRRFADSGSE